MTRLDDELRAIALELSPLIAQRDLDFGIHTDPAPVQAHEWMLRELARNLLHNAIRHTPVSGVLSVELVTDGWHAALTFSDSGPGIGAELAQRLFQPFPRATCGPAPGWGWPSARKSCGRWAGRSNWPIAWKAAAWPDSMPW